MTNSFILIGFDRSGTSAISRTLSKHPQMELIFRPFNSGPIRDKMYRILNTSIVSAEDTTFFTKLEKRELDGSYFVSQWHQKFSTVKNDFKQDQLHVIISNINHFSVRWVKHEFPKIEQWAIWRDPEEILNSCIKNKFYGDWYADALTQVIDTVRSDSELMSLFGKWIEEVLNGNYTIKTAYLLAVRNYFLFNEIDANKVIDYNIFKSNPNKALSPVLQYFGLDQTFDFSPFLDIDLNSIPSIDGYSANKTGENIISLQDMEIAIKMFAPLNNVYSRKFQL